MKECYISGKKGKFFTDEEYYKIVELIRRNNEIIRDLKKEVGA